MASLEGIAPEDQVVLLAGSPLEDEATLGQCGVEALTTLEVPTLLSAASMCHALEGRTTYQATVTGRGSPVA